MVIPGVWRLLRWARNAKKPPTINRGRSAVSVERLCSVPVHSGYFVQDNVALPYLDAVLQRVAQFILWSSNLNNAALRHFC
jgi:hypothetical protein